MNLRSTMNMSVAILIGLLFVGVQHSGSWAEVGMPSATPSTPTDSRVLFAVRPAEDPNNSYFDNVEIDAGQSIKLEMVVLNWGEVPVDLSVYKANVANPVNGGFQVGQQGDSPKNLTSWIEFEDREVSLPPKSQEVMVLTITVPEDTGPGQYVSAMVASTIENLPIPGSENIDHQLRFAMAVSIIVPGEISHSFELGDPVVVENRLQVQVTNTGNYLVKPEGNLVLTDQLGNEILSTSVRMDSVYGGNSTYLEVALPEQIAPAEYSLALELKDPASGFSRQTQGSIVTISEPEEPKALTITGVSIEPNGAVITFANVEVAVQNDGGQLSAANVLLNVFLDGKPFDEFPLATNQVMLSGENIYTARYIPAEMWQSGTYTFALVVHSVEPGGDRKAELLNEPMEVEITVP